MARKEYYSAKEVAAICNVSIKSLHYYEEIKFIVPEIQIGESKSRYYSKKQMETVYMVRHLKLLGFSLKETKKILSEDRIDFLEKSMEKKLHGLWDEIKSLNRQYKEMEGCLHRLKNGHAVLEKQRNPENLPLPLEDEIVLEEVPEISLYYSRQVMEAYRNEEVSLERWVKMSDEVQKNGIETQGPIIVTYYTEPLGQFMGHDCDIEFGIQAVGENENQIRTFGGFQAASIFHIGPYSEIVKSHMKILQWINQNHYKVAGPISEKFIISPIDIKNEKEHVIKILVPVVLNH